MYCVYLHVLTWREEKPSQAYGHLFSLWLKSWWKSLKWILNEFLCYLPNIWNLIKQGFYYLWNFIANILTRLGKLSIYSIYQHVVSWWEKSPSFFMYSFSSFGQCTDVNQGNVLMNFLCCIFNTWNLMKQRFYYSCNFIVNLFIRLR